MYLENFPNATSDLLQEKSPATSNYNCIAWTLGDTETWWSSAPGYFWPPRTPKPMSRLENVVALYRRQGFEECPTPDPEDGFEKVALYVSAGEFVHAALQLADGRWTSKFGKHEDAEHETLESLLGGEFESIGCILKRERKIRRKA